jgi:acyl carrier protein
MNLESVFKTHVGAVCGLDAGSLSLLTTIDEIGLDSFSLVQILTAIESDLEIELQDNQITRLLEARTLGDYLEVLASAADRSRVPAD